MRSLEENKSKLYKLVSVPLLCRVDKTVARLPDEVREFVKENVQFEEACNSMIPRTQFRKKYIVFLKPDFAERTLAHEIAHAYLGHDIDDPDDKIKIGDWEADANRLARKWLKEGKKK